MTQLLAAASGLACLASLWPARPRRRRWRPRCYVCDYEDHSTAETPWRYRRMLVLIPPLVLCSDCAGEVEAEVNAAIAP